MTDTNPLLADYPRLNPAFTPVVVDANEVKFTTGPWNETVYEIADDEEDNILAVLVSELNGTAHVDEIVASFESVPRAEITSVLRHLQNKSIVVDAGRPIDDQRAKLGGFLSQHETDPNPVERVQSATITVVGAGAVGTAVVTDLAGAGVDTIEYLSLSPDTHPLDSAQVDTTLTPLDKTDLAESVSSSEFAMFAADRPYPSIVTKLNELAHETETPLATAVVNGFDGQVGPTIYPGETACYDCFRTRANAATNSRTGYSQFEASEQVAGALLPSLAHVVAGMVTSDVIVQLAGGFGSTTGSVITYDFADFSVQADEVLRLPRCETCGKSADRLDHPRHVTLKHLAEHTSEGE